MKKLQIKLGLLLSLAFLPICLFAQGLNQNVPIESQSFSPERFGSDGQLFLREADLNMRLLDFEGAFLAYENAVAQNPLSVEALLRRATFKKRFGMDVDAKADLRLANRMNPYAANLYGYNGPYGILEVIYNRPENGLTNLNDFQRLGYYYAKLDESFVESTEAREFVLVEEIVLLIEKDSLSEALIITEDLLEEYPNSALGYDLKGLIYSKNGDYNGAVELFSKAIEIEPDFAIAWYNFSQAEMKRGEPEKAVLYLDRAIELQGDLTKAYFDRAMLYKESGKKEKAIEDYNTIIDLKGDQYLEAYLNRGLTKKMLGDYSGALSDLNIVIEKSAPNPMLYKNRGNLYLIFGYYNLAINDYTKAIDLDPNYAEGFYNRALAHFINYDMVSGCRDLEFSIELGFELAEEKQKYFCTE